MTDFQRSAIIGLHFPGHPAPGMGTLHLFLRPADMLALAPQTVRRRPCLAAVKTLKDIAPER